MYPALLLGRDGNVLFPFPKLKRCRNAHALHTVSGPHLACGLSQRHASYDTGREKLSTLLLNSPGLSPLFPWEEMA